MSKNPKFGSGVLFRNKNKLDQLSLTKTESSQAYENAPDLTGNLGFTKSEANALMKFLKAGFEAGKENSYGQIIIGFAATIREHAKGDYISVWCSEPYTAKPQTISEPRSQAPSQAPSQALDDEIPF